MQALGPVQDLSKGLFHHRQLLSGELKGHVLEAGAVGPLVRVRLQIGRYILLFQRGQGLAGSGQSQAAGSTLLPCILDMDSYNARRRSTGTG